MAYKTILVHVDGSAQQESRMRACALLAAADDAHLVGGAATGFSWLDLALLSGSMAAPVSPAGFDALRDTAARHLRLFTEQAARLGVASSEARLVEDVPTYALLLQARYADLVVLSQDDDTLPGQAARVRRLPEHVALHGTRPVLIVPASYGGAPIPGTAVAGWDGSTQALRALNAALPLLARADSVKLALVDPDRLTELHGEEPGADMALWLARHGVRVEVVVERGAVTVGEALIGLARDVQAGLMVAGAYGHSRYREWILGGVTRELLERAPVPLLIAH